MTTLQEYKQAVEQLFENEKTDIHMFLKWRSSPSVTQLLEGLQYAKSKGFRQLFYTTNITVPESILSRLEVDFKIIIYDQKRLVENAVKLGKYDLVKTLEDHIEL